MSNPDNIVPSEPPPILEQLASEIGGTIKSCHRLPDGSAFATISMPLPPGHWSQPEDGKYGPPPMPFRMGADDERRGAFAEAIRAVGQYAYLASTMGGRETDMDPDALLQNLVVGFLGYWTPDGTKVTGAYPEDAKWADPNPMPPIYPGPAPA